MTIFELSETGTFQLTSPLWSRILLWSFWPLSFFKLSVKRNLQTFWGPKCNIFPYCPISIASQSGPHSGPIGSPNGGGAFIAHAVAAKALPSKREAWRLRMRGLDTLWRSHRSVGQLPQMPKTGPIGSNRLGEVLIFVWISSELMVFPVDQLLIRVCHSVIQCYVFVIQRTCG